MLVMQDGLTGEWAKDSVNCKLGRGRQASIELLLKFPDLRTSASLAKYV